MRAGRQAEIQKRQAGRNPLVAAGGRQAGRQNLVAELQNLRQVNGRN